MRRWFYVAPLIAALSGCDSTSEYRTEVSKDLLDPAAAQFRSERVVDLYSSEGSRVKVFCGEINAKNALGALTGFKPFFYVVSRTDSRNVERNLPFRAIYMVGDTIYKLNNEKVYYQYCERSAGKRTDDELWVND